MAKSTKRKVNEINSNILYLHENDAKALGIVEGGVQRVFVDGREVDVTFVDEHEVIAMSNEERKVFEEADRLVAKYANEKMLVSNNENRSNTHHTSSFSSFRDGFLKWFSSNDKDSSYDNGRIPSSSDNEKSSKGKWYYFGFDKPRQNGGRERYEESHRYSTVEDNGSRDDSRSLRMLRRSDDDMGARRREAENRKHRFKVRSDIFTEEELKILEGIIHRSKEGNNRSNFSSNDIRYQEEEIIVSSPKKKKVSSSKVKSKSSNKKKKKK